MKNIIVAAFILFGVSAFAQGALFDDKGFNNREEIGVSRSYLPSYVSLKRYTPSLLYPQALSNCVAHSFSMAKTITTAKKYNVTDPDEISLLHFSTWYMYHELADYNDYSCGEGLIMEEAAEFALNEGFVPLANVEYPNFYPFSETVLCKQTSKDYYPSSLTTDRVEAEKYAFDKVYAIKNTEQLKTALSEGMPVVVGLMIPDSFERAGSFFKLSSYDKLNLDYGHAMVVVGYNDNLYGGVFEIINSWGSEWGSSGFTKVSYADFFEMVRAAYACEDYSRYGKSPSELVINTVEPEIEEKYSTPMSKVEITDERSNLFDNSKLLEAFQAVDKNWDEDDMDKL